MKIIVPMAGRGSRLRPHTLTIPKPLIPVAGKPIVQRLVEDLTKGVSEKVTEIAFITGDFGEEVKKDLLAIAKDLGAKGSVYRQTEPLGTAHAILCAAESLKGNCIVAFADTLFQADFDFNTKEDGIIWVQKVEDPSAYGVIKVDDNNVITEFVEKSPTFVSDMAIVGIYYFNDGENLKKELQFLLDNNIKDKGEFQLTSALENMKSKGLKFKPGKIEEWLDCGNKDAVVHSNQRVLFFNKDNEMVDPSAKVENSVILPPCYIGKNAVIRNSIVGPFVSIGKDSTVENTVVSNTVIQNESNVQNVNISNSMIGNKVEYLGKKVEISIGDYSKYAE